ENETTEKERRGDQHLHPELASTSHRNVVEEQGVFILELSFHVEFSQFPFGSVQNSQVIGKCSSQCQFGFFVNGKEEAKSALLLVEWKISYLEFTDVRDSVCSICDY
ncbi:hypothetical protein PMAYCL1PPCAC_07437, partial [Pristionchus mayeri]